MRIIKAPAKIYKILAQHRFKDKTIGFIPTMGALHEGHLSLIRAARKENDFVVVSIFVNPAQFGPKEGLKRYPRPIGKDLVLCQREGVNFVFIPKVQEIYPQGFSTFINVEGLSEVLCGKSRPGHFRGVATVVAKLLNIVRPDIAYLGQKDAQQALIIKKMVRDLNIPVKIKIMPTIREKDGLAMSSRNVYLNKIKRQDALVLFEALSLAKLLIKNGAKDAERIINKMRQLIRKKKAAKIDYIEIVSLEDLKPLKSVSGNCLIALAVWIGKARLIDNFQIN